MVNQQRVRRGRTGLIAHDPSRALQGLTLFTPMLSDGTVYLVDMRGVRAARTAGWRGTGIAS